MEDIRKLLFEEAEKISISLSDEQLLKFQKYLELLVETNEKVNLTAITEPKEVVMKHFIDSIALFSVCDVKENAKVAFKRNYWLCVLVAIIMGIASGGFGSGSAGDK